ncbi:MAG: tyrosine--tRNA ligase [Actinomycetia bacterium]|nr:tyrosine--tRNA ligase [Actinomycetes bacterium]
MANDRPSNWNAVDLLPAGGLEGKAARGTPLRVKLGIDPTAPDIHLGHTVALGTLAAFQEAGHAAVLIIGDYTARIGDPSGRSGERPVLSADELDRNARSYAEQAFKILDRDRTEVRHNSEWLAKLDFAELLRLTRTMTVARMLKRDDFANRMAAQEPISVTELLYPLVQGYDSVAVQADVELGGTDQLYNLLAGRDVMQAYGLEPQVALTLPILVGTDGTERMSKSRGNYIGVAEPPSDQFGKVMSIPDSATADYWRLCLRRDPPELEPMQAKLALAAAIVTRYHGEPAAAQAEAHFTRVVRERGTPEDVPVLEVAADTVHLPEVLKRQFGESTSHWRRLIEQGSVRVNGVPATELNLPAERLSDALVQAGRRRFVRLRLGTGALEPRSRPDAAGC